MKLKPLRDIAMDVPEGFIRIQMLHLHGRCIRGGCGKHLCCIHLDSLHPAKTLNLSISRFRRAF